MRSRTVAFLAGTIMLLVVAAPGQTNAPDSNVDPGKLEIYSFPTQIRTVARRTFRDEAGRLSREIFYTTSNSNPRAKPSEKELRVQFTHLYRYDPGGLLVELEVRGPDDRVIETKRLEYDEHQQLVLSSSFGPDGILRAKVFSQAGHAVSTITYDASGKRILTLRGRLRADEDLPDGWGETVQGLACGIVLSKTNGVLDDFEVNLHLRNTGDREVAIQALPSGTMVLRDAEGKEIPGKPAKLHAEMTYFYGRLASGEAGHFFPAWAIKDQFAPLPPGRYRLSVGIAIPESDVRLESNPVTFVVK